LSCLIISAFDLQAHWSIYPSTTNYFPLRRAANDTQYTLGKKFLQEAYVRSQMVRAGGITHCTPKRTLLFLLYHASLSFKTRVKTVKTVKK
jgi:hypothetical protein